MVRGHENESLPVREKTGQPANRGSKRAVASRIVHRPGVPRFPGAAGHSIARNARHEAGVAEFELASANTEAPPPAPGLPPPPPPNPYSGAVSLSPADIAMRNKAVRDTLRKWRLGAPASWHEGIKGKFDAAGIATSHT
jgi:hypothetical protein